MIAWLDNSGDLSYSNLIHLIKEIGFRIILFLLNPLSIAAPFKIKLEKILRKALESRRKDVSISFKVTPFLCNHLLLLRCQHFQDFLL